MEGTVITDASPWAYYHKHMLSIAPELRAVYTARLAPLHLPDVTVLLTATGREIARRRSAVERDAMDAFAGIALT